MKTNVPMVREMGSFKVIQRTKDGMFNATALATQWKLVNNERKDVSDFLRLASTNEFMKALEEDNNNTGNPVCKKSKASRGANAGTWMSPLLFIDFAMWLNPAFKVTVLRFVYDQLIEFRNNAGDDYKGLSASASKLKGCDYTVIAKGLNWITFNRHEKDIRNKATQPQLESLVDTQKKLAFAIDMGYIKTFEALREEMLKMYHEKWD